VLIHAITQLASYADVSNDGAGKRVPQGREYLLPHERNATEIHPSTSEKSTRHIDASVPTRVR
jgi:hypothetical protein